MSRSRARNRHTMNFLARVSRLTELEQELAYGALKSQSQDATLRSVAQQRDAADRRARDWRLLCEAVLSAAELQLRGLRLAIDELSASHAATARADQEQQRTGQPISTPSGGWKP